MLPTISVIIPVFNRSHLVKRCLDSVLNQKMKPDEIIVVDNNSTDDTYRTVEEWMNQNRVEGTVLKLICETTPGACAARQSGLNAATSEFVIFFDSDDEMMPSMISTAKGKVAENINIDLVCWPVEIHTLDGKVKLTKRKVSDPFETHLVHSLLRTHGYMVRRDFLNNAGGWKKNLVVWNDLETGARILLNNPRLAYVKQVMAKINSQEISITGRSFSDKEGLWEQTLDEIEKEINDHPSVYTCHIDDILDYRRIVLAASYDKEGNKAGAKRLKTKTLEDIRGLKKILLLFAYHYTRFGGRGAWSIIKYFY